MTEKVSRRSFFKLFGGAVALVAAPTAVIAKAVEIPVEFGWTWFVDKKKLDPSFAELVTQTLKKSSPALRDNLAQNNALFLKLKDGRKAKLNIERISPEEQTERMAKRVVERQRDIKREMQEAFDNRIAYHYRSQKDLDNIAAGKHPSIYKSELEI